MKYVYYEGKEITEEEIKKRAYKIYLRRLVLRKSGDEKSDWFQALKEIVYQKTWEEKVNGHEESLTRY